MTYDLEKEKREAVEAGKRALFYDGKTLQNGPGKTKHGTGEI